MKQPAGTACALPGGFEVDKVKKAYVLPLLALLLWLCLPLCGAGAAEALDVTAECKFKLCYSGKKYTQMTDRKLNTHWDSKKIKQPWIEITAPAGMPIHGVYVCFAVLPDSWELQRDVDGQWETVAEGDPYLHSYVAVPDGSSHLRLRVTQAKAFALSINEIYCFAEGDLPDWVQHWQPTPEKADILFVTAHPGDELVFLGGAVPTYAAEQQRAVVVATCTYGSAERTTEYLNGLWAAGLRTYPVIGPFKGGTAANAAAGYKNSGKSKVLNWVAALFRRYRPEAVVTQSAAGENKKGENAMIADACLQVFEKAAVEGEYLDSYGTYGVWQVKKLYLHLAEEDPLTLDWSVPLLSLQGQSGLEAAQAGWAQHLSQAKLKKPIAVQAAGDDWDSTRFGLVKTVIGPDSRHDDFLEGIYSSPASFVAVTPTPAPLPTATPEPEWTGRMPALNAKGFLDEGEFVLADDTNGLYIYVSQTVKVVIQRKYDGSDPALPLTWFDCELWCDVEAGELPHTIQYDEEKMGRARVDASETALKHQVVFAMNTDYYTYRVASDGSRHTGVVIRDGKVLYDDRWPSETTFFPNLDTLSFYPDGRMEVWHSYELSAQDYLDRGAYDVYSFGPYLLKDGVFSERVFTSNESRNPRCALGMIEPGHYVAIMAEGRLPRSKGVSIRLLAMLMRERGCQVALNLDGGQTAVVVFMGKQLNQIGKYDGKTSARPTSEIFGVGRSAQVGQVEFQ